MNYAWHKRVRRDFSPPSGERVRSATFAEVAGPPPGVLRRKAGTDRRITVGTTVTERIPEGFRSDRRGRGATRGDGARRTRSPVPCFPPFPMRDHSAPSGKF